MRLWKFFLQLVRILYSSIVKQLDDIILLTTFSVVFIILSLVFFRDQVQSQRYDALGGFLGGTVGTVLSIVTVFLVYKTFKLQQKELNDTKSILKTQQFESTFFRMMEMLVSVGRSYESTPFGDFFKGFAIQLKQFYIKGAYRDDRGFLVYMVDQITKKGNENELSNENLSSEVLSEKLYNWIKLSDENYDKYVGLIFSYVYQLNNSRTSHYFRHLYQILKLINAQFPEPEQKETREFYGKLVSSQLDSYQLVVLFYNCLSEEGLSWGDGDGTPIFKSLVRDLGMMDNVEKKFLMSETHCKRFYFYDN